MIMHNGKKYVRVYHNGKCYTDIRVNGVSVLSSIVEESYVFEFDGATNYIDTTIVPNTTTKLSMEDQLTSTKSLQRHGCRTSLSVDMFEIGSEYSLWHVGYGTTNRNAGTRDTDKHLTEFYDGDLYKDSEVVQTNTGTLEGATQSIFIGTLNDGGTPSSNHYVTAKIGWIEIIHNGVTKLFKPDKDTNSFKDEEGNLYPIQGTILEEQWSSKILLTQGYYDLNVIPDSFNTGLEDGVTLTESTGAGTYGEIQLIEASGGSFLGINFSSNLYLSTTEELLCEGFDFSGEVNFTILNTHSVPESNPCAIRFKNCKLNSVTMAYLENNTNIIFEHCIILGSLSNSGFEAYYNFFGGEGSIADAIRPLRNVTAKYNYIADKAHKTDIASYHTDGVQIYGYSGVDAENILVEYNRFDLPDIKYDYNDGTYVNAALMLQLEYSDGINIVLRNNIYTAGGFDEYAWSKIYTGPWTFTDCIISGNKYGVTHQYSDMYYREEDGVVLSPDPTIAYTESTPVDDVMVSSVSQTEVIYSNYTNVIHTLRIMTDVETLEISVPACPTFDEIVVHDIDETVGTNFEDLPFDISQALSGTPSFVACWDVTDGEPADVDAETIRFVNFSAEDIYIAA